MLDGVITDRKEAEALNIGIDNGAVHIFSSSWGPSDGGYTVEGFGPLALQAVVRGVTKVLYGWCRNSIKFNVFGAGNFSWQL